MGFDYGICGRGRGVVRFNYLILPCDARECVLWIWMCLCRCGYRCGCGLWVGWFVLERWGEAYVVFVPSGWGIYAMGCVLSFLSDFLMWLGSRAGYGSLWYAVLMLSFVYDGG